MPETSFSAEHWHASTVEIQNAVSQNGRRRVLGRRGDPVDGLVGRGALGPAEEAAARLLRVDWYLSQTAPVSSVQWWSDRVDGGKASSPAERRLFHRQRYEAALTSLGQDPEEQLDDIAQWIAVEELGAVQIGRRFGITHRHTAAGAGGMLIRLVLHRLARFYGLKKAPPCGHAPRASTAA